MDGLEDIMPNEMSDKYHVISLICGIEKNKINEQTQQKQTHTENKQIDGC